MNNKDFADEDREHRETRFRPMVRTDGFTLLELLVVIVILGLLAAYVAPRYFSQIGKSEVAVARAQIGAFDKALEQFRIDVGRFPTAQEGLSALIARPPGEARWNGPYLKKSIPNDPWSRPYLYRTPGSRSEYEILSLGKDGSAGGSGENADISSE